MAKAFMSSGVQTASVLLRAIPLDQHPSLVESLTASLRSNFDEGTASLLVELMSRQADKRAKQNLLDLLIAQVEEGSPGTAALLSLQSLDLAKDLLDIATDRLYQIVGEWDGQPDRVIPGFTGILPVHLAHSASSSPEKDGGQPPKVAMQWLRLVKSLAAADLLEQRNERLVYSALFLLGAIDQPTSLAARDVVFSLLPTGSLSEESIKLIPKAMTALLSSHLKNHQTLGYTLWLRSLAASDQSGSSILAITATDYWKPIHHGLRHGDTERRKLCLEILKRSVALAIENGQMATVNPDRKGSEAAIISQYSRYCTVFETVVLARYTNLVVECKKDLDLLASSASAVDPDWLYTLLATALDTRTQDQNRRFIGNWILEIQLDTTRCKAGFLAFLDEQYLPWVTEGHLFIASITQIDTVLRCAHGDRLAEFIFRIMQQHAKDQRALEQLLQIILQFLVRKQNTLFAYAAVHLLRGISRAFAEISSLYLNTAQLETLLALCSWRALPEVARDVSVMHCWRIYNLSNDRAARQHTDNISPLAHGQLIGLQADAAAIISTDAAAGEQSPMRERSQRDVAITAAVKKCDTMKEDTESATQNDTSHLRDLLEDIWSDLEYLEYPRELLIKIPAVIFNDAIVKAALQEDTDTLTGVRAFLLATLPRLLALAQRRSFLLAQMIPALRNVFLSTPEIAEVFDIEDCILQIARDPPDASIDLRIEYATLPLLSEVLPNGGDTQMKRYFGPGEGFGFAAYVDLISRMGEVRPKLIESILEALLSRWKRQKTPIPVMSGWKTTLQLQVMLLCLEQYIPAAEATALEATLKDLYHILSIEPLPRYRYLLEWMIVRIQVQHTRLRSQISPLLSIKDHHSNPKYLASLMKIGVTLAVTETATDEFAVELASVFIGLSASSKIVIRHEAQWSFPLLMDRAREQNWTRITRNPAYVALDDYIRSLPRFDDPPPERGLSKLDPSTDSTLTHLTEGPWTGLDNTRQPFARHRDFLVLYESDHLHSKTQIPPSCLPLGPPLALPTLQPTHPPTTTPTSSAPPEPTQQETTALQTKGTAYLKPPLTSPSATTPRQHNLQLIATLIENPYNLGGLSRCGEIFGAQNLYVRDTRVTSDKDFASVAVSSHHHLPILPLPVAQLSEFLQARKAEGWTVVGVEQTDRSVLLGEKECVLPEKTVLVLGSEREGMPAAVLSECDLLVEIPQEGVTRSLNVQTAAAIVLFEFGRQRKLGR